MFACNGILFNHESPLRGETFVTRKITRALSRIHTGLQDVVYLGNLDAKRDWGHAKDFVKAQWLILQHDKPEDFVIATGQQYSVRDFIEIALQQIGISIAWKGSGVDEVGIVASNENAMGVAPGQIIVRVDPRYFRPTEVNSLLGDPSKARALLNWEPQISFPDLVKEMIREDVTIAERDAVVARKGYKVFDHHE